LWDTYARDWCEHKPSITVYVREHEWFDVGAWTYRNFNTISGVSYLPYDTGSYRQAPYEGIGKVKYGDLSKELPALSFEGFREDVDSTTASQELACVGGVCEL